MFLATLLRQYTTTRKSENQCVDKLRRNALNVLKIFIFCCNNIENAVAQYKKYNKKKNISKKYATTLNIFKLKDNGISLQNVQTFKWVYNFNSFNAFQFNRLAKKCGCITNLFRLPILFSYLANRFLWFFHSFFTFQVFNKEISKTIEKIEKSEISLLNFERKCGFARYKNKITF